MAIRSKQTQVEAVGLKSSMTKEGRLKRGRRFFTTLARIEVLEKQGLAQLVKTTKVVEPEAEKKASPKKASPKKAATK